MKKIISSTIVALFIVSSTGIIFMIEAQAYHCRADTTSCK